MLLEQLKELVRLKISLEYDEFRMDLLKKEPEEIINLAYKICSFENMFDFLVAILENAGEEDVIKILMFPNLMEYLYSEWISYEDSSAEDWEGFLRLQISELDKTEECDAKNNINS